MADANPTTSSASATPRLHLLNLPQELQDSIFAFAYCRSPDAKIVAREGWALRQYGKRQNYADEQAFVPKPFPGNKVSDFMVSKRYFVSAANAYVSSQPLYLDSLGGTIISEPFWTDGVIAEFARHVVGDYTVCLFLFRMANLRTLQIELSVHNLKNAEDEIRPIFDRPMTRSDLAKLSTSELFDNSSIKGFSSFGIIAPDTEDYGLTEQQEAMFTANINMLQAFLEPKVLAPKIAEYLAMTTASKDSTALYTGSKVSFQTCAIHKSASRREIVEGLRSLSLHIMGGPTPAPLIEATVFELLDIALDKGVKTGINIGDEAVMGKQASLRAQTESRLHIAEAGWRQSENRRKEVESILRLISFAAFVAWVLWTLSLLRRWWHEE